MKRDGEADERFWTKVRKAAPIEVIQETYQTYFIDSTDKFNRTLFRFLLESAR